MGLSLAAFAFFLVAAGGFGAAPVSSPAGTVGLGVPFVENAGQVADQDVRFAAQTFGGGVFLTRSGEIVYCLPRRTAAGGATLVLRERPVNFQGREPAGLERSAARISWFTGNDPRRWRSDLAAWNRVDFGEICAGVHLAVTAGGHNVEKIFTVAPGADAGRIRLEIAGAGGLAVDGAGQLAVDTALGRVAFSKPVAYQMRGERREPVEVNYRLDGHTYGFAVGKYDPALPLVIDPILATTLVGGGGNDLANAIALDREGNVLVAGTTPAVEYPVTVKAGHGKIGGAGQVFVSKFDEGLTKLLASALIGGSDDEEGMDLAIEAKSGSVYVLGHTRSADFPVTAGAYCSTNRGGWDVFLAKLDGGLGQLQAATLLGGKDNDRGYALALDGEGNIYLTGCAASADYPVTAGAYCGTWQGGFCDIMVSKFDGGLGKLLASTFVGGGGQAWEADIAYRLALDGGGNVYVAGYTESANFPTTPGAYNNRLITCGGLVVCKLDGALSKLLAATRVGAYDTTFANGLAVSPAGSVYVKGCTSAFNYPTTSNSFETIRRGRTDGFVSKFSGDLSELQASTFLGSSGVDWQGPGHTLVLDAAGNVYVTGSAASGLRTAPSFCEFFQGGPSDAFVSKLDGDLKNLLAAAFLGGKGEDHGRAMALDKSGNIYVTGYTASSNFPAAGKPYQPALKGSQDVFVARLDGNLLGPTKEDLMWAGDKEAPAAYRWADTVLVANFYHQTKRDTSFVGSNHWDMGTCQWKHNGTNGWIEFNGGETDYLKIKDSPSLHNISQMTVAMWLRLPPAGADGPYPFLICKGGNGGRNAPYPRDWGLLTAARGKKWILNGEFPFKKAKSGENSEIRIGGVEITPNTWHHVAATYDGKNMLFYLDGAVQTNASLSLVGDAGGAQPSVQTNDLDCAGALAVLHNPLLIGRREGDHGNVGRLRGAMDLIRIYKVALSAKEIAALFEAGRQTAPGQR
jgi:hypothetical protein